jgi:hypothetical protein
MKEWRVLRFGYIGACITLMLVFMVFTVKQVNNHRTYNWDLLGYVAVLNGYQTADPVSIHQNSYRQVGERITADAYRLLTQDIEPDERGPRNYRADMASDAAHFAQMLPFYRIRPFYTGSLWLLTKMGAHPVDSVYLLNFFSLSLFITILFLWLKQLLSLWKATFLSILLTLGLQTVSVAKLAGPDLFSAAWLLLGFYYLIQSKRMYCGLLLIFLSIGIRTDNILLLFSTLLMLVLYQRLVWTAAGSIAAAGFLLYLSINYFAGNYGWWTVFYFTFIYSVNTPADTTPPFSAMVYLKYWVQALPKSLAWHPLFAMFWTINLLCLAQKKYPSIVMLALILAFSVAAKFVLFPAAWERFFLLYYALNALCLVMLLVRVEPVTTVDPEVQTKNQ